MKSKYQKYFDANKKLWNNKTAFHINSEFYDMKGFRKKGISLMPTELNELGGVEGKSILHLQCHFGQDSISLSKLGAEVTAVDFSEDAINYAVNLAAELKTETKFICANVYDLPDILHKKFDIVFTSYGTIGWLPDLKKWAVVISKFLKRGGLFYIVEFHPHIMMYDEEFEYIKYSYFFDKHPIIEEYNGTYADRDAPIKNVSYGWNHPISEVLNSLLDQNFTLRQFNEFNFSHYNCFPNMKKIGDNKFVFKNFEDKIPYMYSLKAIKN
jgi:ubiquinone/menaquinone biosynthesis C-methylase UbiE